MHCFPSIDSTAANALAEGDTAGIERVMTTWLDILADGRGSGSDQKQEIYFFLVIVVVLPIPVLSSGSRQHSYLKQSLSAPFPDSSRLPAVSSVFLGIHYPSRAPSRSWISCISSDQDPPRIALASSPSLGLISETSRRRAPPTRPLPPSAADSSHTAVLGV
ncbi:hypothetical protein NEOLEDRAFT_889007 [Neolentinus lepideus HHB14362 ss-1]|uniref:Uncharacterized protein n=1 Tax=Neolentinus lepideus HHB14362 ss-1 TaxID=1314782 RepID=A0A165NV70_9AGAM|nr:hypothetical protein NEOLEDRAFT_889007 [Neolentinus lepideus HHB14362 ss-1]